jgi:hypothetical protein
MFLSYSENAKLAGSEPEDAIQVAPRRKAIAYDAPRIKALESVSEWDRFDATWEDRLSELDYRKIHGHCNVPTDTAKHQAC